MSAQHTVTVELDEDGDPLTVRFACTGTAADICHQWCAEGCEEQCTGGNIILSGADVELVAQAPLDGHRWEPMPPHGQSCLIVDWLDTVGWMDTGWVDDPDDGGEREVTPGDLRPGTHLLEEEWTGDDYIWRYAEPAAEVAA